MEAVRTEGPGVGPHLSVVVQVEDVDGAQGTGGKGDPLHREGLRQVAGDEGHRAVQSHTFLDYLAQVLQLGQVAPRCIFFYKDCHDDTDDDDDDDYDDDGHRAVQSHTFLDHLAQVF